MFEKEAIRHAFEDTIGVECLIKPVEDFTYEELSDEQQEKAYDFKKGAEFGYKLAHEEMDYLNKHWGNGKDKANEWHFVKNGDLPKDNKEYLVLYYFNYRGKKETHCGVRDNLHNDFEIHRCYTEQIIAWKEIVLPKESE